MGSPTLICDFPFPDVTLNSDWSFAFKAIVLCQTRLCEQTPAQIKPSDYWASISEFAFLNVPRTAQPLKTSILVFYTLAVVTYQTSWAASLRKASLAALILPSVNVT